MGIQERRVFSFTDVRIPRLKTTIPGNSRILCPKYQMCTSTARVALKCNTQNRALPEFISGKYSRYPASIPWNAHCVDQKTQQIILKFKI